MREYLRASEAAAELGITVASLYKLRKHDDPVKRLEPFNPSTYKGDGGFVYRREDVDRVKPSYVKEDLTVTKAAERIGRSTTFIHKLIRDRLLPYYEGIYRGKKTFFIRPADLEKFAASNPDSGKYDMIYDRKTGVFLYQSFQNGGKLARIVQIKRVNRRKKEIILQVGTDELINYEDALAAGWAPSLTISDRKPITSYGYARFDFPLPTASDSMIYGIIEELFKQVGPANIRITAGERVVVEVRKSVLVGIMPTSHPDLIDKLKLFLVQGEIVPKYDGTLIDTGLSPITFYVTGEKKAELLQRAAEAGKTLQEWIVETV
ncbi:helix-turn-helix domain-containing protein [Paenibacillus gansuensis]|uniref:Helix-turn-helix domain-containing protein n=1 Tax=Paenibacillus gansuensis TaxID=306542 RepID=A0ABW5PI61_9BACL